MTQKTPVQVARCRECNKRVTSVAERCSHCLALWPARPRIEKYWTEAVQSRRGLAGCTPVLALGLLSAGLVYAVLQGGV